MECGKMKLKVVIDKEKDEEIIIYTHEKNELVTAIENLVNNSQMNLIGFDRGVMCPLNLNDISVFYTKDNKVYANALGKPYLLNYRLYKIEENLNNSFVKINQGCIVNISKIKRFEMSVGGFVQVVMKDGYKDFISRRELKNVKRRMGI
jgi:DNA-binding LytR/AlgR family response regulator